MWRKCSVAETKCLKPFEHFEPFELRICFPLCVAASLWWSLLRHTDDEDGLVVGLVAVGSGGVEEGAGDEGAGASHGGLGASGAPTLRARRGGGQARRGRDAATLTCRGRCSGR